MIELPEAMRVFNRTYQVEDIPKMAKHMWNGLLDHPRAKIFIDANLDSELVLQTILHEAFHIFQIESMLPVDEHNCNSMAHFVYQLLYDNPWIARAFCIEEEEEEKKEETA